MNYYISEQNGNERNALTKARQDVQVIMRKLGWKEKTIHRKIQGQHKIVHYIRMGFWTFIDWKRILYGMEPKSTVLIQFPMVNNLFFNESAAREIQKFKRKKQLKIILLIHDIDSLRFPEQCKKQEKHEDIFWRIADIIIAHNENMREYLEKKISKPIIALGIFDYLLEQEVIRDRIKTNQIVIAGNLDGNKAGYLWHLKEIKGVNFCLYGPNFNEDMSGENTLYKGVYSPEELPEKVEGSWGLVWDGISIKTCTGDYGNYLQYNNPHKLSFYVALGLPIIIWEKAALSNFVKNNKIGITVQSLQNVETELNAVSQQEYEQLLENVKRISQKARNGDYLKNVIDKCKYLF